MSEKNKQAAMQRWAATRIVRSNQKRLARDLRILAAVIRHEATKIRFREANRRRALAAYHDAGYKRHLRAGLLSAARRMIAPKPIRYQVSRLVAAAQVAARRYYARQNRAARAKLVRILRRRLENSMHCLKAGASKSRTARTLVGCDLDFLRTHLEKQFQPGMTWDNHGYAGWHVDHREPLAGFDLTNPEEAARAFHFSNLQPLWAKENLEKGCSLARPVVTSTHDLKN